MTDEDDDASADEENLAAKIAILERLRGRRGTQRQGLLLCATLISIPTELEQALGIPFPV